MMNNGKLPEDDKSKRANYPAGLPVYPQSGSGNPDLESGSSNLEPGSHNLATNTQAAGVVNATAVQPDAPVAVPSNASSDKVIRNNTVTIAGFLITFFGSVLFSTKAIIVKKAFADTPMDALSLLALRMMFSLPFFVGAAIFASSRDQNKVLTTRQWLTVIVLGLFGYYLSSFFDFVGLQYISAGLERLILFLYPSFAVLINTFFFKQKITRMQVVALALTYFGIAVAYVGEMRIESGNPNFVLGSFLIFLCAITYSIYIAGSGRIIPVVGGTKFTAYAMLASTAGILLHFALRGDYSMLNGDQDFWFYGILLALLATVIPSFMISNGLKRIGANNVAIISSIGPVSTILQAHFILGERIIAAQIFGTVMVIAGILLTGWKTKKDLSANKHGSKA